MRLIALILVFFMLAGGCRSSSSGIVPISGDTYMVSRSSPAGAFASMPALQADTIREANKFAASKGKVAVAISITPYRPATGFPSVDYQFRLVDKDSPEARGQNLRQAPDTFVEVQNNLPPTQPASVAHPDLYTELTKLDDLRKRGLITDAEFETQKSAIMKRSQ